MVRLCKGYLCRCGRQLGVNQPELTPQATKDYPTPAMRPRNSVLSNEKLHARFGVRLASWQSALDTVLKTLHSTSGGQN